MRIVTITMIMIIITKQKEFFSKGNFSERFFCNGNSSPFFNLILASLHCDTGEVFDEKKATEKSNFAVMIIL